MKKDYVVTFIFSNLGFIGCGILGYWYILASDILKGDPNAGFANLALILVAAFIIEVFAMIGGIVFCYLGLRINHLQHAFKTTWILGLLYVICFIASLFFVPLSIVMLFLPLFARSMVVK